MSLDHVTIIPCTLPIGVVNGIELTKKKSPKLGLFSMVKPNRTEPNQTEIDNMVWIWYIPYKLNGYDF